MPEEFIGMEDWSLGLGWYGSRDRAVTLNARRGPKAVQEKLFIEGWSHRTGSTLSPRAAVELDPLGGKQVSVAMRYHGPDYQATLKTSRHASANQGGVCTVADGNA